MILRRKLEMFCWPDNQIKLSLRFRKTVAVLTAELIELGLIAIGPQS